MAGKSDDFLYSDDLDAILSLIEADAFEEDEVIEAELDAVVDSIPEEAQKPTFPCCFCTKVCLTSQGLKRHVTAKHKDESSSNTQLPFEEDEVMEAELDDVVDPVPGEAQKPTFPCLLCTKVCLSSQGLKRHVTAKHIELSPTTQLPSFTVVNLKTYIKICIEDIAKDQCYSEETLKEFSRVDLDQIDFDKIYSVIQNPIRKFKGNPDKFYPEFLNLFANNTKELFKVLNGSNVSLLGLDLSNHILAHLTCSVLKEGNVVTQDIEVVRLSDKDKSIISYISGFVFRKLYCRIFYKSSKNMIKSSYNQQCLALLNAGKKLSVEDSEDSNNPESKLINVRDRGGLWKVKHDVICIFTQAEIQFQKVTKDFKRQIDSESIVKDLLVNIEVLSYFNKIKESADIVTEKEVMVNLLESALMLYIRVRSFAFAKNKQQIHQIQNKKKRSRSLRTEIKKLTSTLDQGH